MDDLRAGEWEEFTRFTVNRVLRHGPGWRLTYRMNRLIRAGDRGDWIAIDAVWQCWLHRPDPRWWTALARWRCPASAASPPGVRPLSLVALDDPLIGWSADGLIDALGRTWHPIAGIARRRLAAPGDRISLDELCLAAVDRMDAVSLLRAAGIRPADPAIRAAFLLLARQQQEYWELDPDQRLLAQAYRRFPGLRAPLRRLMPEFGDIDSARVLADALAGAERTPDEADHLLSLAIRDEDWAGLWHVARDLPPIDAVEALQHADPGWRPPDGDGAELYTLLRTADPQHLRERADALAAPRTLPVDGAVLHGAFSADERTVAVTVLSRVLVFDVESGTLTATHEMDCGDPGPVSFQGPAPIVGQRWPGRGPVRSTVWRLGPGRRTGKAVNGWVHDLQPGTLDGATQLAAVRSAPGEFWPQVRLLRRHGPPSVRRPAAGFDLTCRILDTDPIDGRVAFAGDRITVAGLGHGNRLRAPVTSPHLRAKQWWGLCLAGPDLVFSCDQDGVTRWRIADGRLTDTVTRKHPYGTLVWVPYRNAVAVVDPCHGVQYLDADTLEPQDQPGELYGLSGAIHLWSAPRRTGTHAAARGGEIRIVLAAGAQLAALARQPMARPAPAPVPADPVTGDRAGVLLDVLAANHRFRASVRSAG